MMFLLHSSDHVRMSPFYFANAETASIRISLTHVKKKSIISCLIACRVVSGSSGPRTGTLVAYERNVYLYCTFFKASQSLYEVEHSNRLFLANPPLLVLAGEIHRRARERDGGSMPAYGRKQREKFSNLPSIHGIYLPFSSSSPNPAPPFLPIRALRLGKLLHQ
jgi:hypothetical protein